MQTKEETTKLFMADLQALLDKWDAELYAEDHFMGYAECGEDVRITVDIPSIYTKDGDMVREMTEIDLGSRVFPKEKA